jgi:hypothetical protein
MNLDEKDFYAQSPAVLSDIYTLLAPFSAFIMAMDRQEFARRFDAFLSGKGPIDAAGLDFGFDQFLKSSSMTLPTQRICSTQLRNLVTLCLREGDFISAHTGSLSMAEYNPQNPLGPIFMGDVFWRMQDPYIALEYYTLANSLVVNSGDDTSRVRIDSRLADAFQALGDAELAKRKLRSLSAASPEKLPIDLTIVLFRSKLKLLVYEIAEHQRLAAEDIPPMLIEMYVHALQGWRCAPDEDRARFQQIVEMMSSGNEAGVRRLMEQHFITVSKAAQDELVGSDWHRVLENKLLNCK